ncbi:MAG TPA: hypothetical protein VGI12_09590 [Vicinamibacterales bacterium]
MRLTMNRANRMGIWQGSLGVVAAALAAFAWSSVVAAQIPNAAAAINAAKDARAKTEAAQQKNAEALTPSGQKPAEQVPPAPPAAPAPPVRSGAQPGSASGYTYDPAGRRDPFVSLLGRGNDGVATGARPQGLPGLMINELTLKGVMKTPKGEFVALLQAPDSKSYIGHAGEKVLDGAIKAVTAVEVVFTQDVNDPLSLVKQREVRKAIRAEAR